MFPLPFTKITEIPIGPISIQVWGLMIAVAMLVALWISFREADRKNVNHDLILDLFFWMLVSSMVGGRLFFVALFWEDFAKDPIQIFEVWKGGMVFLGGVFAALLAIWTIVMMKKVSFWKIMDLFAPGLALGIFVGRIGCYLIGDHIGAGMQHHFFLGSMVPGDDRLRHEPSLYLSLNGLFLFFIIWSLRKKIQTPGRLAFLFFVWEGFSRFFLDFFRANDLPGLSDPRFWGLTLSQHLSIAMFLVAGFFFLFPRFYLKNLMKRS